MQTKEKITHLRAQSAHLRNHNPCHHKHFFRTGAVYEGLARRSALLPAIVSPQESSTCLSRFDLLGQETSSLALEPQSWQQNA